jgi:CDP-paratose synthetase
MNILISGSTGFIGKHLLNSLLSNNKINIGILIRNFDKANELNVKKLVIININIADWKTKIKEFNPYIVIHLAAYLTSSDDEVSISKLIDGNITFGSHILDALKNTNIKYFINTGTSTEYRINSNETHPTYLYSATKSAFRNILKYYQTLIDFKIINIIPYSIYGGEDTQKKLIDFIFQSTQDNNPINMSPGEQVLDFIHIVDVVDFFNELINNINNIKENYTELQLGTSIGTTPKKLASIIESVLKTKANINWGGIPYRHSDTMYSVADISTTCSLFKWNPNITLEKGVDMYIKKMKKK